MKLVNIFWAKHPEDKSVKPYMFSAPLNKNIRKGEEYLCKCISGEKKVIAVTKNIVVPKEYAKELMPLFGATYLAPCIGEYVPVSTMEVNRWEVKNG